MFPTIHVEKEVCFTILWLNANSQLGKNFGNEWGPKWSIPPFQYDILGTSDKHLKTGGKKRIQFMKIFIFSLQFMASDNTEVISDIYSLVCSCIRIKVKWEIDNIKKYQIP